MKKIISIAKCILLCYNDLRTTVYFVFYEGGDESSPFHPSLTYSLYKPTKKLSSANRKRFLQKLFMLNGLLHSA